MSRLQSPPGPPPQGSSKALNAPSTPDLRLVGHEEEALFPLAACSSAPYVASGGSDKLVLLWSIQVGETVRRRYGFQRGIVLQDHMETLLAGSSHDPKAKNPQAAVTGPELSARTILRQVWASVGVSPLPCHHPSSTRGPGGTRTRLRIWCSSRARASS